MITLQPTLESRGIDKEREMSLMRFTNWDKYKDNRTICKIVGCNQEDTQVCCPDLDGTLCKRKSKYLMQLGIREKDLDNNLFTVEEIIEGNKSLYEDMLGRHELIRSESMGIIKKSFLYIGVITVVIVVHSLIEIVSPSFARSLLMGATAVYIYRKIEETD